jgi:hypothetical protein
LIFSKESLNNFIDAINQREENYYPITRKFKPIDSLKENPTSKYKFDFDPNAELVIHTPALQGSSKRILKYEANPESLYAEIQRRYEQRATDKAKIKRGKFEEQLKRAEQNLMKKGRKK